MSSGKKFFQLEDRVVLDAAAVATTGEVFQDYSDDQQDNDASIENVQAQAALDQLTHNASPLANRVVVIDERADPNGEIVDILNDKNIAVIVVGADDDPNAAIESALESNNTVDTIHIVSFESGDDLLLGNDVVDAAEIAEYHDILHDNSSDIISSTEIILFSNQDSDGLNGLEYVGQYNDTEVQNNIPSTPELNSNSSNSPAPKEEASVENLIGQSSSHNSPPTANDFIFETTRAQTVEIRLDGGDELKSELRFMIDTIPNSQTEGVLKLNGETLEVGDKISFDERQDLIFVPQRDFIGTVSFNYKAIDTGNLESDSVTHTIIVRDGGLENLTFSNNITVREGTNFVFSDDDVNYKVENLDPFATYAIRIDISGYDSEHTAGIDQALIDNGTVQLINSSNNPAGLVSENNSNFLLFQGSAEDITEALETLQYHASGDGDASDQIVICLYRLMENGSFEHIDINNVMATIEFNLDANDDSFTTQEDTSLVFNEQELLDNDENKSNLDFHLTFTQPENGYLEYNQSTGTFTYTPNENYTGEDSFTYTLCVDDQQTTATVTINVTPANDAPVAADDSASTDEDTPVTINVLNNDSDADGDALTIQSVTNPANGSVSIVNGQIEYTPDANFTGDDSFTYTVSDGNGSSSTATVNVTVVPEQTNDAPIANNDSAIVLQDSTGNQIDVLSNDTDPNGDDISIFSVADPANGTVSIEDGQIIYTPDEGFSGADSFTYRIVDSNGNVSLAANVSIFVRATTFIPDTDSPEVVPVLSTVPDDRVVVDSSDPAPTILSQGTLFRGDVTSEDDRSLDDEDDYELRLEYYLQDVVLNDLNKYQTFSIPAAISNTYSETEITYKAMLLDGSELPSWLTFDAERRIFEVMPHEDRGEIYNIVVIAETDDGQEARTSFNLIFVDEELSAMILGDVSVAENDNLPLTDTLTASLLLTESSDSSDNNQTKVAFTNQLNNSFETILDQDASKLINETYRL
ncbi:MAG: Ig-like domain-containing protein [Rickettsiales bacterium]|nr:Ig-like domain-containing protein [Rickettsiales bacterium]